MRTLDPSSSSFLVLLSAKGCATHRGGRFCGCERRSPARGDVLGKKQAPRARFYTCKIGGWMLSIPRAVKLY